MGGPMGSHLFARQSEGLPVGLAFGEELVADVGHPEFAVRTLVIEEPHRAGLALRLIDECLDELAKEGVDVGLTHDEIEWQVRGVALDVRHTLRALARDGLPGELRLEPFETGGPEFCRPERRQRLVALRRDASPIGHRTGFIGFPFHALIMLLRRRRGIVRRSQVRMGDRSRAPVAPLPDCYEWFSSPDFRAWKRIAFERFSC